MQKRCQKNGVRKMKFDGREKGIGAKEGNAEKPQPKKVEPRISRMARMGNDSDTLACLGGSNSASANLPAWMRKEEEQ